MKILFADDHSLIREGVCSLLRTFSNASEILEASNFNDALSIASSEKQINLIILDLFMPGMNYFRGLDTMHGRFPDIPIVILTGNVDMNDAIASLEHGASGYIPKTIGSKSMLNALELILSGEKFLPSRLVSDAFHSERDKALRRPANLSKLTGRELQVLSHLSKGQPNKEIARRLNLQEVTIKAHLKGVYRKLGVHNRTQAVRAAMQTGIEEDYFDSLRIGI